MYFSLPARRSFRPRKSVMNKAQNALIPNPNNVYTAPHKQVDKHSANNSLGTIICFFMRRALSVRDVKAMKRTDEWLQCHEFNEEMTTLSEKF